jgi:arylsulfatase
LILITVDCLRRDHAGGEHAPHIEAFRRESVSFTGCLASGPVTPFAFRGLFTGQFPLLYWQNGNMPAEIQTLAEVLGQAGYRTVGIHDNPYLSRQFGYNRGFDIFIDDAAEYDSMTSETIVEMAKIHIQGVKPFFIWIHFMDLHGPYMFPDRYFREVKLGKFFGRRVRKQLKKNFRNITGKPKKEEAARRLYRAALRWTDHKLGELLRFCRDEGLYEDSLVILSADHGEGLGEHGYFGHFSWLDNAVLGIPLMIRRPGETDMREIPHPVSQLDIMPTALGLLGVRHQAGPGGVSLLPLLSGGSPPQRPYIISECLHKGYRCTPKQGLFYDFRTGYKKCALRGGDLKYVWDGEDDSEQVFDIAHDPGEQNPLAPLPAAAERMRQVRKEHCSLLDAAEQGDGGTESGTVDDRVKERLRALGYME